GSSKIWKDVTMWFGMHSLPQKVEDLIVAMDRLSPLIKQLWQAASITSIVHLWKKRNKVLYDELNVSNMFILNEVKRSTTWAYSQSKRHMENSTQDLTIMKNLGLQTRFKSPPKVIECYWSLPPEGWIKVNMDGASKGNPGVAGWGAVSRRDDGAMIEVAIGGLGVETYFIAEMVAIIE
ncbi:Ribonuclease h domain, partial [Thalictrum thalictroides]